MTKQDGHQAGGSGRRDLTLSGFVAASVTLACFAAGMYWVSLQQTRAQDWITHTHEVLATIATTRADLVDVQNGQRGFVITGRTEDLQPYEAARRAIGADVQRLRELTADNPAQQASTADLETALGPRLASAAAIVEARRRGGIEAARAIVESGEPAQQMLQLRDVLQRMAIEESRQLDLALDEHERELHTFWAGIAAMVAALVAVLAVLYRQQQRRQRAEEELLASERRFHDMTDSVSEYAIMMLDAQGRVQTWNTGAARIKGYAAAEVVGEHFSRFFTPEDREAGEPGRVLAAAARSGRFATEAWRVRKDGSRFWATVVVAPMKDAQGNVTGFSKIVRDLTQRRQAEEALRARELSTRLIAAQEEERRHIARELHDETGQALTLIRLLLTELEQQPHAGPDKAAEGMRLVDRAIAHIRGLSLRLRPPMLDDLGLADAIDSVLEQQARASGWRVTKVLPELEDRLPDEIETACFRICQEALTNAARYSGATEVAVILRVDAEGLALEVRDNGRGFELARYQTPEERRKHFGLVSMTERAALVGGELAITTAPGQGTRVRVRLPLRAMDLAGHAGADA
ncbi:CHASE3 domain-containing protein [Ramlibacter sp. AN1133]|uniref:CHASE3 domain-containing protein n=1 Tax=Ramlibacter sp. AN1133 TaxID=3133429 RepID=UPI0030C2FE61